MSITRVTTIFSRLVLFGAITFATMANAVSVANAKSAEYAFTPANRAYSKGQSNQANLNYVAQACGTCADDTTGVFRPSNGLLYLKNSNTAGFADTAINYGTGGDYPVAGDWDGNGTATIGVYRNGSFYLRNSNTLGFADLVFAFGQPGDQPIVGDWNGDGTDTIGVYRSSTGRFLLRNSNTSGATEMSFYLGNVGDVGIAGDWNGDGIDTTGAFRPSNGVIFLKNTNSTGFADMALNYGLAGDQPVTGDWNGDGIDTIGVYRNGKFLLRNSNTIGVADIVFSLGNPGDMPIAGNWAKTVNIPSLNSRGYQTTPQELREIAGKANEGLEPYHSAVTDVLQWANKDWNYALQTEETCGNSDEPAWINNRGGTPILYAKAIAYHLTGNGRYAEEVKTILQRIMTEVLAISVADNQCRLNFAWGTPELVASADLIEDYWKAQTCTGPISTSYLNSEISSGNCKTLFQNWLVKNPYYIVSYSAESSQSNWGAAATNTTAYISDYLWDRPEVLLVHRLRLEVNGEKFVMYSPSTAFVHANQLALDRMNGYAVESSSTSCDLLNGPQQSSNWAPVKSQISELGIIPEDARRQEYCNIPGYNGTYQNYPQIHLGNNIQQCELMLRRGDASCFDNVDMSDLPIYTYVGPDGVQKTTHLYPGRGSIERAIKAVIVDSGTEWSHGSALEVAFRYYYMHHRLPGLEQWAAQLNSQSQDCSQDICFGMLTHGFSIGKEIPNRPPTVSPP